MSTANSACQLRTGLQTPVCACSGISRAEDQDLFMSRDRCELCSLQVAALWQNEAKLAALSQAAAMKARSWSETANAAGLMNILEKTMKLQQM